MPSKRTIPRVCPICAQPFFPFLTDVKRGKGKVCSPFCRDALFRKPKVVVEPGPSTKKHGPWRERFWRKVNKQGPTPPHRADLGPCWQWLSHVDPGGYGRFTRVARVSEYAHRIVYVEMIGPIEGALEIDHVCHNGDPLCDDGTSCLHRRCVNPAHLEAVPHKVNALRGNGYHAKSVRRAAQAVT